MFKIEDSLLIMADFQEKLSPALYDSEKLLKRIELLIRGCRILDIPILAIQQYTKGLGETVQVLKDALGEFEHIEKITFSCYKEPTFVQKLRSSGRKNIIVSGVEAHICIQQTVLDLLAADYNVYVIADCIGSRSENDRIYAESRMRQAGAVLTTAESVLFELLENANHPKRKEITKLVK